MMAYVCELPDRPAAVVYADPICGSDFCDDCGDCLHCYGEDACGAGGDHFWVVYADQVVEFESNHPEAVATP